MSPPSQSGKKESPRGLLPAPLTPLFHTPLYQELSPDQAVRYNEITGYYFNEQIIFLETVFAQPLIEGCLKNARTVPLRENLKQFLKEEYEHSEMFRAFNRRRAPAWYARNDFHFIPVSAPLRSTLKVIAGKPSLFPMMIWLMHLLEERSFYTGTEVLKHQAELDPDIVAMHRKHVADEVDHIRWDQELLNIFWVGASRWKQAANLRLFAWIVREYFTAPKRSAVRVLTTLIAEYPDLKHKAPNLLAALGDLSHDPVFLSEQYSRKSHPRTLAMFDRVGGFDRLSQALPGYCPEEVTP